MFPDDIQQLLINLFLVILSLITHNIALLFAGKNVLISRTARTAAAVSFALEIVVVQMVGQLDLADVQTSLGGNHKFWTNTTQGAVVQLQRTRHQNQSTWQLFQIHHSFAPMTSGQNNYHSARLKTLAQFMHVFASRQLVFRRSADFLSLTVQQAGNAAFGNFPFASIFLASNLFSDNFVKLLFRLNFSDSLERFFSCICL